mmetsp:Transcript_4528/g.8126  ORF Transcript_4528/g.8126 Transcript_4528/m.8126 type:complete len:86 (-) Transcript_4528:65-322(-)
MLQHGGGQICGGAMLHTAGLAGFMIKIPGGSIHSGPGGALTRQCKQKVRKHLAAWSPSRKQLDSCSGGAAEDLLGCLMLQHIPGI